MHFYDVIAAVINAFWETLLLPSYLVSVVLASHSYLFVSGFVHIPFRTTFQALSAMYQQEALSLLAQNMAMHVHNMDGGLLRKALADTGLTVGDVRGDLL